MTGWVQRLDVSTAQASALIEGPITESQSFYLGARRSYIDLIMSKEDFAGEERHNGAAGSAVL